MQKTINILLFLLFTSTFAQIKYGNPQVSPIEVQQNFGNWWKYHHENIMLSRDFIALDSLSKEISKESFLNELILVRFIPVKMESYDDIFYYKLFKIETTTDSSIKATIEQEAFEELKNFKMEGSTFPKISFKDLNGNLVSNESMKGKITVIKCWYIHCAACIKEFPEVNRLVMEYMDRKDIQFVSLAEDNPEQLSAFLAKKTLLYSVIPNMKNYMNGTLNLNAFPTHFIINREGLIVKVVSDYKSLEIALAKESKL